MKSGLCLDHRLWAEQNGEFSPQLDDPAQRRKLGFVYKPDWKLLVGRGPL